jgi:hypothetical protein
MMAAPMKENTWIRLLAYVTGMGQSRVAPPERIFGCRESNFARPSARPIALVRSGKILWFDTIPFKCNELIMNTGPDLFLANHRCSAVV